MSSELAKFVATHEHNFMPEPNSGCWLWTAGRTGAGYGLITVNGARTLVHRAAFIAAHGPLLEGMTEVRHSCDTPACMNPDHLLQGTHTDNMRDMNRRNRRGSRCILTKEAVTSIREAVRGGALPMVLAKQYGVHSSTVTAAAAGDAWGIIETPVARCGKLVGSRAPWAKLNESQVTEIKKSLSALTNKELGKRFNVHRGVINNIRSGKNWKHVTI